MDDVLVVGGLQCVAALDDDVDDTLPGKPPIFLERASQVFTIAQVLHDHERRAVGRSAEVVDIDDVLAPDLRGGPGLTAESLHRFGQRHSAGRKTLTAHFFPISVCSARNTQPIAPSPIRLTSL